MISSSSSRAVPALLATLLLVIVGQSISFAEEAKPEIDATADKRLQAMSEYLGGLKRFSVDVQHSMEIQVEGKDVQSRSDQRHVIIEQPNRLAATASGDGEGTVICDGKQLFAYWPATERYLLGEAPATFAEILQREAVMLLGSGATAVQFATGEWHKQVAKSASKIALLEPEKVEDVACDRIEITKEKAKVILWVEQGEHPLLRKMQWELQMEMPNAKSTKASQIVTYSDWKLEPKINAKTFAIEVPKDAEKVDTLRTKDPGEGPHKLVGAKVPDCELALLEGGTQKLADLKDKKVVVLDFWALWCEPCVEALPKIDQLAAKFADRDVAFFAVNSGDVADEISKFREKLKLQLPIAVDPNSELSKLFDAGTIPMTVIVDKQGRVQVVSIGAGDNVEKMLTDKIEAVLAGKQLAEETLKEAREARRGGKPIPAGPDAMTSQNATEDRIAFNLRTSVEAYKKVGSRNEAWDEAVIAFLTEASRHFSFAKGCKTHAEMVALAEPLAEQGCDDPLVKYVHGAMLQDGVKDAASQARALKLVEESYHGLVERGYPANRRFGAAHRMHRALKKDPSQAEKAEEYLVLTEKHSLESILQDDLKTNDGRTLYGHLWNFAQTLPPERMEQFCEAAKAHEEKSPFIVNMLLGEYHIVAAWKARGSSYAPDVTEEGWKGFADQMELARTAFEKAWKVAPKRPEGAAGMVTISMGAGRSPEREMRKWFDRAVEAQMDYLPVYTRLLQGLMPRWHGSHEQMYQFGVECIENGRYDTDVPYQFCDAVFQIMRDDHNSLGTRYAQRPGLYQNVEKVCQGYIAQAKDKSNVVWWKTTCLGFAYLAERWEDAARLLKELESKPDAEALSRFPLVADQVIQAVSLHASPHANAILTAFAAADNGQREEAVEGLKTILTKEDLDPSLKTPLASRLQGLEWGGEFLKGEGVSLIPAEGVRGWKTVSGKWSRTSAGDLKGVSDEAGVILECQGDFGQRWKLSGEVEYGKSRYNPWDAGVLLYVDGVPQFSMMFNPTEGWVAVAPEGELKRFRQPFTPNGKTVKFVVQVAGGTVNVWLNDVQVIQDQEVEGLSSAISPRVAIGAKYRWSGSVLTYRNLKIEPIEPKE